MVQSIVIIAVVVAVAAILGIAYLMRRISFIKSDLDDYKDTYEKLIKTYTDLKGAYDLLYKKYETLLAIELANNKYLKDHNDRLHALKHGYCYGCQQKDYSGLNPGEITCND